MSLRDRLRTMRDNWSTLRRSSGFRSVALYFVFVIIAALFWVMMALNDNIQQNVDVNLRIYNVPDSATFINIPPAQLHVTVRDKGTSLLRTSLLRNPVMSINFKEYASGGVLRIPPSELFVLLRGSFGPSTQISSVSVDSLHLSYTTNPGRQVPVVVRADLDAADGYVISGNLRISNSRVTIFSNSQEADTISKVYTARFVRRNLSSTDKVNVQLTPIPGVRMIPPKVTVTVPVETLVKKKAMVPVNVINVPANESLLIFPANVEVTFFVPMSSFNDDDNDIAVLADYNDIRGHRSRMPIKVGHHGAGCVNVTLLTDSVEYTIVRQ